MTEKLPLTEDDLAEPGLIAPGAMRTHGSVPPDVVLCFFPEVIAAFAGHAREAAVLHSENGRSPVLAVTRPDGTEVGVVHPGVGAPMAVGRTWTTDAVYRETRGPTDRRRGEGCLTVEMEAAALIAVARFRGVAFSQVLFAGDSLAGEEWDHRRWTTAHDARRALAEVVVGVSPP